MSAHHDVPTALAIGDSGRFEPTPVDEVVEIQATPLGMDNIILPASIRALRKTPSESTPLRLLSIHKPGTRLNHRTFPKITFQCTPYERYRTKDGPVLGDIGVCFVCTESDATDTLFDTLTTKERSRILRAVTASGQAIRATR